MACNTLSARQYRARLGEVTQLLHRMLKASGGRVPGDGESCGIESYRVHDRARPGSLPGSSCTECSLPKYEGLLRLWYIQSLVQSVRTCKFKGRRPSHNNQMRQWGVVVFPQQCASPCARALPIEEGIDYLAVLNLDCLYLGFPFLCLCLVDA